jgi:hypothetical protein
VKPFDRLKQLYHDTIRAIHARFTHTRACPGCEQCAALGARETQARQAYDTGLRELIG